MLPESKLPLIYGDYDNSSILVDPAQLLTAYRTLSDEAESISGYLKKIYKALSDLRLSWAGDSSAALQTYNDEWNAAVEGLFGTGSPDTGALSVLVSGLATAAVNYSNTEQSIQSMFRKLQSTPNSGGSTTTGQPQPEANTALDQPTERFVGAESWQYRYHTTSVDEHF